MKLSLYTDDLRDAACDVVAVGVFSDEPDRGLSFSHLNRALDGSLEQACRDEDFKGRSHESVVFNVRDGLAARRVFVFGFGERAKYDAEVARAFAGAAARAAVQTGARSLALQLTVPDESTLDVLSLVGALGEGAILGAYRYVSHKSKDSQRPLLAETQVAFVAEDVQGIKGTALRQTLAQAKIVAEATCAARDLVNEPPNVLSPEELADRARKMAKQAGLTCKVLGPRDLERQGMQLLLGVAKGSAFEPRLIHLTYAPETKPTRTVVFAGKGVTFDAGGLSLKTASGMRDMKVDMGGAAAVLGAMQAIAALKPDCVVHGLVGAVENMPDGRAIRPGDVWKSKKGITVEIINTDAEGRLVLADVLAYAQELKPDDIIDLATLTGACMVALGRNLAGAFLRDDALAARFDRAVAASGEAFWRMPLDPTIREQLDSDVADITNLGERYGGAISAALFLQDFVDPGVGWGHLDIAGPVWATKALGHAGKGATGFGVRTLVAYTTLAETEDA